MIDARPETMAETDPKPRSRKASSSRRSLFLSILLLAVILLLVVSFITFRQLRAAEENRLRVLAGFAGQIEATVLDLVQRYVNVVNLARETGRIRQNLEDVPNVSLVAGPLMRPETERHLEVDARGPKVYLRYFTGRPPQVELDTTPETGPQDPSARATGREGATPDSESTALYVGLLDLPGVVEPVVIPEAFDLVVLARRGDEEDEGTVLFQHGTGELKLAEVASAWEVRTRGLMESLRRAWSDAADTPPSGGGTRVLETQIAGTEYRIFVQPVTLQLRDTDGNPLSEPQEWVACGMISWENLLASSFTTSPAILFLMVALIPLMLVAWPFLKMWLISRRQPFRRFDTAFLVLSCLLGISLLTLLVLDLVFLSELQATVDGQLEEIATALEGSLWTELEDTVAVLDQAGSHGALRGCFSYRAGSSPPCPPAAAGTGPCQLPGSPRASPEGDSGDDEWSCVRQRLTAALGGPEAIRSTFDYPFLHSIYWIDADGAQVSKIPFHRDSILLNNVRDRQYFRCPQEAGAAPLYAAGGPTAVLRTPDRPLSEGSPVCVQSIRSKTTAGDLAVVSIPAPETTPTPGPDDSPEVIALTTRLVSLNRALLPPGFAFAVVDRRGAVLFHSDPRRNVSEDFLKATGGDAVLRALLAERRRGPLSINYWGTRYRAYVRPLDRLPWSLVSLRSTRDLRTRNFELIYDFLNPFLVYSLPLAGALLLGIAFLPARALRFLLPSRHFTPMYRAVALVVPLTIGLSALALRWGGPWLVLLASWLLPQAVLGAAAVASFRRSCPSMPKPEPREMETGLKRLTRILSTLQEPTWKEWLLLVSGFVLAVVAARFGGHEPILWFLVATATAAAVAFVSLKRAFVDHTTVAPYVTALAAVLVGAAVLPALGLFRLAESRQTQLLIQDGQAGLLRAAPRREAELLSDRGPLWRHLASTSKESGTAGAEHESGEASPAELESYRSEIDRFAKGTAEGFFESRLLRAPDEGTDEAPGFLWPYGRAEPGEAGDAGPVAGGPARLLSSRPFPLNDLTAQPVGTDLSRFGHSGMTWSLVRGEEDTAEENERVEPTRLLRVELEDRPVGSSPGWEPVLGLASAFEPTGLPGEVPLLRTLFLGGASLGLLALVVGGAAFVARKIALVDLAPNRKQAAIDQLLRQVCYNGRRAQRLLVRTSLPDAVEQMARGPVFRDRIHVLPFGTFWEESAEAREFSFFHALDEEPAERPDGKPAPGFRPRALLITDFRPDLSDLNATKEQIDLLRRLETHGLPEDDPQLRGRSVMIVTSRPYHRLARPRPSFDLTDEVEARSRWHAYFARFGQRHARDEGKPTMFTSWIDWKRRWLEAGKRPPREEPDWFLDADHKVEEIRVEATDGLREAFPEPPEPGSPKTWRFHRLAGLLKVLREECRWTWRLQRAGLDVLRELEEELYEEPAEGDEPDAVQAWNPPTARQLVNRIGVAAQPYYERIWDGCEEDEKRVLYHLSRHGVANPKSLDVVLDLLNKGLVIRTPENPILRPMNRSFADFVRRSVHRSEAWQWEEEEGLSAWEIWKWVLPIPLLLLGAFLFMTQQDALSNVIGLAVALASLVPTGINLYQHFQQLTAEREATGG